MKRRGKTKKPACDANKKTNCAPCSLKGSIRSDQMLTAGLVIVILASIVVIVSAAHSWKGQFRGEKEGSQSASVQNLQAQINALKKEVAKNKTTSAVSSTTTASGVQQEPTSQISSTSAFEKAVNDKNFTQMEALMADRVYFVEDATDCCGDVTKKEAMKNFKLYTANTESFNFDQNQQVVKQMKVNLADTFAKYTIGIADNKMVLSFHLDAQGKVDDLMLSASHLMYDLE
jgi:hypothetical protein